MIAFIDDHRAAYGVEPICQVLRIAPSTYHARAAVRLDPAKGSTRSQRDGELCAEIRRVHEANFGVYGVRKVWRQLRREGILAVTLNSAPRHAPIRQVITLQIGTRSRSKPAPDHAAIRHLLRRASGHSLQQVSLNSINVY
jgi:hypothetical protein